MKKHYLAFFCILISLSLHSQIQVEYEVSSSWDNNPKSIKTEKMVLQHLNGKSMFFSKEKWIGMQKMKKDISKGSVNFMQNRVAYGSGLSAEKVEKNFPTNMLKFYDIILKDQFSYEESIPKIEWKITNKKEEILGHKVGIAKGEFRGRNYTAWYAEDIPIADGPYKFSGLPGLILKIEEDNGNFSYSAITISKLDAIDNVIDGKWIKTSREKYQEVKKKSVTNIVDYVNQNTEVMITPVNGSPQKNDNKKYNPIELK